MTPTAQPGTVGPTLRSWHLRALLGVACTLTIVVTVVWAEPHPLVVALLAAGGLYTAMQPHSHAATTMIALVIIVVMMADPGLSAWAMGAVLGVHATHMLAAVAAVVPLDAAVERAALAPSARRFAVVQAASQSLVLLALMVSP